MIDLIACWVLFPAALALICAGVGTLVEFAAGARLGPALLLPIGFAGVIVVMDLLTRDPGLAPLAPAAAIALGAAGLTARLMTRDRRAWRLPRPGLGTAAALVVFACFAAPVVASGHPTFEGYIKLDDTSTWLALVDRVLGHGRTLTGLEPSTYRSTLEAYLNGAYPLGSLLPIGLGHVLSGRDSAFVVAPYMAFAAALGALALYSLAASLLRSPAHRLLAAAIGGQSALLYGYAGWGGVKEVVAAALAAAFAAAAGRADPARPRTLLAPLLVAVALVVSLSLGGLVWALPAAALIALPRLLYAARRHGSFRPRPAALVPLVVLAGLAALELHRDFFTSNLGSFSHYEIANLQHPLSAWQALGVWPAGDFRADPVHPALAYALMALVAVGALVGVVGSALRVREEIGGGAASLALPAYVLGSLAATAVVAAATSPWLSAKALATAGPALPLAALVGAGLLHEHGRRAEAGVLAVAIAAGVLWSNALAYRDDNLAPYGRMHELQHIAALIAGQGPTLMTDYEPYGVRHFLRSADAEGASELRPRLVPLRAGGVLGKGGSAEIGAFATQAVFEHRTLVLRRGPLASRPPAAYRLIWQGGYYDVWQRAALAAPPLAELALGTGASAAAVPDCRTVAALARTPGAAVLAAPARRPPVYVPLALERAGSVRLRLRLPAAGRWSVWVGGAWPGRLAASLDGRIVASARDELQYAGNFISLGATVVAAHGAHTLLLRAGGGDAHPGSGGRPAVLGPVVLSSEADSPPVAHVPVRDYRRLCGRYLDWVEALAS